MKKIMFLSMFLTGCIGQEHFYNNEPEFDWMPSDLLWQRNIRDCRSQPQCNAADLFQRT